jgi:hypothetical protein
VWLATSVLGLCFVAVPAVTIGQTNDERTTPYDPNETVLKYDLAGPRLGATFAPDGSAISQFGWHVENQAGPSERGPWFIVERVFLVLVGGMERDAFIPSGTLIFGMRLPSSFEFGVGPSVRLGGPRGLDTGLVAAAGHSFRVGGIRVPVNVAYAAQQGGQGRWTLVTGWAIRDRVGQATVAPPRPEAPPGESI